MSGCPCPHVRSADDEDVFPDELKMPVGLADDMLDDAVITPTVDVNDGPETQEESSPHQETSDKSSAMVRIFQGTLGDDKCLTCITTGLS